MADVDRVANDGDRTGAGQDRCGSLEIDRVRAGAAVDGQFLVVRQRQAADVDRVVAGQRVDVHRSCEQSERDRHRCRAVTRAAACQCAIQRTEQVDTETVVVGDRERRSIARERQVVGCIATVGIGDDQIVSAERDGGLCRDYGQNDVVVSRSTGIRNSQT